MRFRAWAGSVLVVMWSLSASSQAEASLLTMGEFEGSGIVWDGDSDVRTSNIFGAGLTAVPGDPTGMGIDVSLTGDTSVDILLRLVFTPDLSGTDPSTFDFPSDWRTLEDVSPSSLQNEFFEMSTGTLPSTEGLPIVALTFDFNVSGPGRIGFGSGREAALTTLLSTYDDLDFYVGILASIRNNSMAPDARITFDVNGGTTTPPPASVPEPSTALLLGVGAVGMIGRRLRKRA